MNTPTPTPRTDEWEAYCDECYYHLWRLRRKTERGWYDGFHIHTGEEAKGLCDLLNNLETKLAAAREELKAVTEQRDKALQKIKNQAERIAYLEGATNHATGTPLSKAIEQRDSLAEALKRIANNNVQDEPHTCYAYEFGRMEGIAKIALAAVKGGSDE